MFYFIQEAYIYNFADNNLLYSIEDNFKETKTILKKNFQLLQVCFFSEPHGLKSRKILLLMDKDIANESIELGNKTSYMPRLNRNPLI